MKLNNQLKNIQNIHLSTESMITLSTIGFLSILPLIIMFIPREDTEIDPSSTVNLAMPKPPKDTIVFTDTLLPKENPSKP